MWIFSPVVDFDYAALGHLHRAQQMGETSIRYCGTLLKYSVSEAEHKKNLYMIDLKGKGEGFHMELLSASIKRCAQGKGIWLKFLKMPAPDNREDYISITLTDEIDPYKPKEQLEKGILSYSGNPYG